MTLPYELAKELKDAGFQSNGQAWCEELKEILPVPNLEELVEACGEDFYCLTRLKDAYGVAWCAESAKSFSGKEGYGSIAVASPEEAVARLWLALNRKT